MLRQTAAPGGPRARWAWGCLLGASLVAGAGCDQRNLAVITLSGVPGSAMATTAYYRLDGAEWKSLVPQRGLQQFGIELPKGRSAKLETQIFTYANRIPCSLGNAAGVAELDGGSIRELSLDVTATTGKLLYDGLHADTYIACKRTKSLVSLLDDYGPPPPTFALTSPGR
ncbi:MAG TPA: hypothetical protein PLW65_01740 [Pseudomonadota bacterium]|nr:hypothetical protein [Pseudomonadota bacterium]